MTTEKLAELQKKAAEIERLKNLLSGLKANGLRASLSAPVGHLTNQVYNTETETNPVLAGYWKMTFADFTEAVNKVIAQAEKEFENA